MTNPDDYYMHRKIWVTGPHFSARGATPLEAENFLRLIQDLVQTGHDCRIALDYQRIDTRAARKERDEALDQVKALQNEVNRLEAELQAERSKRSCMSLGPAYMANGKDVSWTRKGRASDSLPGMHHIIFESEEEAQDGVQILNTLVKQRDQARARVAELEGDKMKCPKAEEETLLGPARDKALARVVGIKLMLGEIKACCSAADYLVSSLQDTIEQGGAK